MSQRPIPAIDPRPDELIFVREPFSTFFVMHMPWRDSFRLSLDDAVIYLKVLGMKRPDVFLDVVWNFFAAWLSTMSWEIQVVPRESVRLALEKDIDRLPSGFLALL